MSVTEFEPPELSVLEAQVVVHIEECFQRAMHNFLGIRKAYIPKGLMTEVATMIRRLTATLPTGLRGVVVFVLFHPLDPHPMGGPRGDIHLGEFRVDHEVPTISAVTVTFYERAGYSFSRRFPRKVSDFLRLNYLKLDSRFDSKIERVYGSGEDEWF